MLWPLATGLPKTMQQSMAISCMGVHVQLSHAAPLPAYLSRWFQNTAPLQATHTV